MAALLTQLGVFAVVLLTGLFFHRFRDQLGRTPFAATVGMTAAVLATADVLGVGTRFGVTALPLSTVSLLPPWLALGVIAWLGRGREDISSFVLPQTSILLLWALGLVLFNQVAHAPWGVAEAVAPALAGGPNRIGVIAFTAAGGMAATLSSYRTLRARAADQPLILRTALAAALGCAFSIALEIALSAGAVPLVTDWVPAAGALLLLGLAAGAVAGGYLELERRRLGDSGVDQLTSNLDWAARDDVQEPYVRLFWENAEPALVADARSSRILVANLAAQELIARPNEALVGKKISSLLGREARPSGSAVRCKLNRARGEPVAVEVLCTPIDLPERTIYLVNIRDITEQLASVERVVESERLEVVSRLAGGIAHDFNNLLQGILGYTDFLKPDSDPELVEQGLQTIQRYAQRGAELARSMQTLSRDQEAVRGACDARSAVHNVAQVVRGGLGRGITVQVRTSDDDTFVSLAPTRLEELLLELSLNARDSMPTNGVLRMTVGLSHIDALDVEQGIDVLPGEYVEISVKDNGTGMSPEMRRVALEPYTTNKEGASGMGLAVVYSTVKSVDGWMSIDSIEGQGTVIRLLFPRLYAPDPQQEADPSLLPLADYPRRILVVDDESDLREMIEVILSSRGFDVVQAADGGEALDLLSNDQEFDTILLDMVMPGVDGAAVIRELHRRECDIPIVMATGFAPEELDPECRKLVSGTLRKPFMAKDLVTALEASWKPLPIF